MPKKLSIPKTTASISMTPEAWALLHQAAKSAGLSKSEYLEMLVRRGDQSLYELVRSTLMVIYQENGEYIDAIDNRIECLRFRNQGIRELLRAIGVSPNQFPAPNTGEVPLVDS
jgi:hypothetical protein